MRLPPQMLNLDFPMTQNIANNTFTSFMSATCCVSVLLVRIRALIFGMMVFLHPCFQVQGSSSHLWLGVLKTTGWPAQSGWTPLLGGLLGGPCSLLQIWEALGHQNKQHRVRGEGNLTGAYGEPLTGEGSLPGTIWDLWAPPCIAP